MVQFIDDHRDAYGVESICTVVPIAPSTYFWHKARHADPTRRSARVHRDDGWRREIQRVWDDNQQVYGPRKVWRQLRRDGHRVARCTVGRLMRAMGLRGAVRGRAWVTTTQADSGADRPVDLVDRHFVATRPNQLWVSDFTYVATWRGFVYVAFVIDVFARRIVGWRACRIRSARTSSSMRLSRPSTIVAVTARATWCITATAARRIQPVVSRCAMQRRLRRSGQTGRRRPAMRSPRPPATGRASSNGSAIGAGAVE